MVHSCEGLYRTYWFTLGQCYIGLRGSFYIVAISPKMAHLTGMVPRPEWFTRTLCYIEGSGSLTLYATSGTLVHSSTVLYHS